MFLRLDGTFWIQLVNFVIFFALLNVVFLRPVSRAIKKRREYINSVTTDYDRFQAEARELREQAEALRAGARRDAETILARARADASNETATLSTHYGQQVQQAVESATRTVAGELNEARANEQQLVLQLAAVMVERTVAEAAT
jgi:F-type H+-transporting ATPase subunit b